MGRMEGERLTQREDALREKRKTETEVGGLREERFGGIGRGVENERGMGEWRRVVETAIKWEQ